MRSGDGDLSAKELLVIVDEFRRRISVSAKKICIPIENMEHHIAESRTDGSPNRLTHSDFPKRPIGVADAAVYLDRQIDQLNGELKNMESNREMYNKYMAAYHKKYSLSLACFIFVLVGAPLGVLARRGGFGVGASMSLLFFVLYWMLMISGEKIAERGILDPIISMWLANAVMACIGIGLVFSLNGSVFNTSR